MMPQSPGSPDHGGPPTAEERSPAQPTDAVQPGAAALFAAGLAHHQAGRLAEAEAHYRRILAVVPDHADALHLLGGTAYQVGRPAAALEFFKIKVKNPLKG